MKEKIYGVEQSNHGHCYRWIYDAKTLKQHGVCPDGTYRSFSVDISFPIGGSNSSATEFVELENEDEVRAFLFSDYDTDYEDPMLIDIAEGIVTIATDEASITGNYVKSLGIKEDELTRPNGLLDDVEDMIRFLKENDYDCDIDYDNPFYGSSRNMRYSELNEIYENAKAYER